MRTLSFSILILSISCTQHQQIDDVLETPIEKKYESSKVDIAIQLPSFQENYYNDIAQFLAGLEGDRNDSKLIDFKSLRSWKDYSSQVNRSWLRFEERKLSAIKPWVVQNILDKGRCQENVFYPFSGPDFTYLNALLPNAKNYYLFGLEPVGLVPDVNSMNKDSMNQLYSAMNQAIYDNLHLSFFITKNMKQEINNEQITGTIPVLLFFLARNGKLIENIEALEIDDEGKLIVKNSIDPIDKPFKKIVRIDFRDNVQGPTKSLHYFSMNIANRGFSRDSIMGKFFSALPDDMTTMVKSASYCMHENKYSKIREVVLKKSKFLIEDDSGIPYRFLSPKQWDTFCFGNYEKPIKVFSNYLQDDLKRAFEKSFKLPFRFGYDYPSNLLIADRKDNR